MASRVLLVEDNELNREMLSRRLTRKGFAVLQAVDGLQGVQMATELLPELVLMDMSLPGIDGWEATRRLKAAPATAHLPVIALTAHAMSDDRSKALAAGCDDFDTKPVDLDRLLAKMAALLPPAALWFTELNLPAVPESLPAFQAALDTLCQQAGLTGELRGTLHVVLDEVCANVFQHAYESGAAGPLRLALRHFAASSAGPQARPAAVTLSFSDDGRPFNPLLQPAPDVSLPLDERPLGGLGIHFVRQMTDQQRYRHSPEEGNCLTLVKHLPAPAA